MSDATFQLLDIFLLTPELFLYLKGPRATSDHKHNRFGIQKNCLGFH